MSIRQPSCPRCQDDLFVRAEQVISGRRVTQAYYCGRCNDEWQVENSPQTVERRQTEHRAQQLDQAIAGLEKLDKKVATAIVGGKHRWRSAR